MKSTLFILIIILNISALNAKEKYLIVTNEKYYNSEILNEFIEYRSVDFKVEKVLNTTIGDISEDFRSYIMKEIPAYVLLVGNYSDFPAKTIPYPKPVESYNYWVAEQVDSLFRITIPIGLFFVENEVELENMVSKTIRFEQNSEEIPQKLYTHSGSIEPLHPWPLDFNDELLNEMYDLFFKNNGFLHRHETSLDETPNDAISDVQAINNGVKYILYHGHGNIQKWTYGMGVQGIEYLVNDEYFPIIFSASCLTGTFTGKIGVMEAECFATKMIASKNGGVAFVGAFNESGRGQNPLLNGFCKAVNDNANTRLGEALLHAFNSQELPETAIKYYPHVEAPLFNRARLQFHLFGDPALKIHYSSSSVKNNDLTGSVTISPNPASDYIEISSSSINPTVNRRVDESSDIKIFNTLGECVVTVETRHAVSLQRIDVSHLPVGLYIIKIGNFVEKFMVVR
ncbi:MAG: C25 family cysteine peptidase [Candidatus Kapabacteria bacterium]|nr:C25 family cysteine peptidase [Candidatus Kapabacteria bacterium]